MKPQNECDDDDIYAVVGESKCIFLIHFMNDQQELVGIHFKATFYFEY